MVQTTIIVQKLLNVIEEVAFVVAMNGQQQLSWRRFKTIVLYTFVWLWVFSSHFKGVDSSPQDKYKSHYDQDDDDEEESNFNTYEYDDMGMRIRWPKGSNLGSSKGQEEEVVPPKGGHVPGGLPIISDSAFSLVILLYVSIAFLFVFFLFCWKTNTNTDGNGEELKQQCPLMTSETLQSTLGVKVPNVIPPTPTIDNVTLAAVDEEKETTSV